MKQPFMKSLRQVGGLAAAAVVLLASTLSHAAGPQGNVGTSPWGPDDEIGTLHMMTPERQADLLARAEGGKTYDLGVEYFVGMPACCGYFGDPPYQHWMTQGPARGEPAEAVSHSGDAISTYTHMGTHIDALNHFGLHGKIWNGVSETDALGTRGWTKSGMDAYPPILARGILIDVAASKGVEVLPTSYKITAQDLKEALARQNTTLMPGDVVLIRTGLMKHWPDPQKYQLMTQAGIGLDAAEWLADSQKAMLIGADNFGVEAFPSGDPQNFAPVHSYLLAERGLSLLEVVWLEDLAKDNVYEFLFLASPLKLKGATASPLRPIAIPLRDR